MRHWSISRRERPMSSQICFRQDFKAILWLMRRHECPPCLQFHWRVLDDLRLERRIGTPLGISEFFGIVLRKPVLIILYFAPPVCIPPSTATLAEAADVAESSAFPTDDLSVPFASGASTLANEWLIKRCRLHAAEEFGTVMLFSKVPKTRQHCWVIHH